MRGLCADGRPCVACVQVAQAQRQLRSLRASIASAANGVSSQLQAAGARVSTQPCGGRSAACTERQRVARRHRYLHNRTWRKGNDHDAVRGSLCRVWPRNCLPLRVCRAGAWRWWRMCGRLAVRMAMQRLQAPHEAWLARMADLCHDRLPPLGYAYWWCMACWCAWLVRVE